MDERLRELSEHYSAVLTILTLGYDEPNLVGDKILPVVAFPSLKVKAPVYNRDSFRVAGKARPLYGVPETVSTVREWKDYDLEEIALGAKIDSKERLALKTAEDAWDLESAQAFVAKSMVQNSIELSIAKHLQSADNYIPDAVIPVASGEKWNAKTAGISDVNPLIPIIEEARAIRKRIGRQPNVMWMGSDVWWAIETNTQVHDFLFGLGVPGQVTRDLVRARLGLDKLVVGDNVVLQGDGSTEELVDVWGDYCGLAYIAPQNSRRAPTYGFIAMGTWSNPGNIRSTGIVTRWDENPYVRRVDYSCWVKAHTAMKEAGALFIGCVA